MNMNKEFYELLDNERLIAIVRETSAEKAEKFAAAVLEGGGRLLEISLTTPDALGVMRKLQGMYPNALIGAGTVVDMERAVLAAEAGAQFAVMPNLDEEVVRYLTARGIPVLPGVATVSEIVRARAAGAKAVKLFPASAYGVGFVRAVHSPLPDCKIIAVGGVNTENALSWLEAGAAGVGIGASLAKDGEDISASARRLKGLLQRSK